MYGESGLCFAFIRIFCLRMIEDDQKSMQRPFFSQSPYRVGSSPSFLPPSSVLETGGLLLPVPMAGVDFVTFVTDSSCPDSVVRMTALSLLIFRMNPFVSRMGQ